MSLPLAGVRLLCTDVDGVWTTGAIPYDADGRRGAIFNARDGMGVTLALAAGLEVALVSGAVSQAVRARAADLGIRHVRDGVPDKAAAVRALGRELGIETGATLFLGDDLNDLAAFAAAGVRVAVADAAPELAASADWVTSRRGGEGAFREVVEAVLRAQGRWDAVVRERFGTPATLGG